MMKKLHPVWSNGSLTIGYDLDKKPGVWPGNLAFTCEETEFADANIGTRVHDITNDIEVVYLLMSNKFGDLYWGVI